MRVDERMKKRKVLSYDDETMLNKQKAKRERRLRKTEREYKRMV